MSRTALEEQRDRHLAGEETLQDIRFRENENAREVERVRFRETYVASPGSIPNLPPLLEARRLLYDIPDMFFRSQACNDKVNIFQLSTASDEFYEGGLIAMPDWKRDQVLQEAPQGILVGAGLKAMDQMHSNGYWLGHKVNFIRMSPYMKNVGTIHGKEQFVLCMTCGDITDSEDLANYMRNGHVRVGRRSWELDDGTRGTEHFLEDTKSDGIWDPSEAVMLDDERDA